MLGVPGEGVRAYYWYVAMPADLIYLPDDTTARVTPDALRIMLRQSGFACTAGPADGPPGGGGPSILLTAHRTVLRLGVESGFVTRVAVGVTFVDDQANANTDLVCELLESMGWLPADE